MTTSPNPAAGTSRYFGAESRRFPGPEVLETLDGDAILFDKPHILTIPGVPELLARIYPKGGADDNPDNWRRLERVNEVQMRHWQIMADAQDYFGVPPFRSFVARLPQHLRSQGRYARRPLGLVSILPVIEGEEAAKGTTPYSEIVHGYTSYLASVAFDSTVLHFLNDPGPHQVLGRTVVDIEPVLSERSLLRVQGQVDKLRGMLPKNTTEPLGIRTAVLLDRLKEQASLRLAEYPHPYDDGLI